MAKLTDNRILAFDSRDRKPVYLMAPRLAPSGKYFPARGGVVEVKDGVVTSVSPNAASTSAVVVHGWDAKQKKEITGKEKSSRAHVAKIDTFAIKQKIKSPYSQGIGQIVDLANRKLLLIREGKAFVLQVAPARDGTYFALGVGEVHVVGGT